MTKFVSQMAILGAIAVVGCKNRPKEMTELAAAPNQPQAAMEVLHADHDGGLYRHIAEKFTKENLNLKVNLKYLKIAWPLRDKTYPLLTRFGTPAMVASEGSSDDSWFVYLHEGLDMTTPTAKGGEEVRAPVSGKATIIYDTDDDATTQGKAAPYATAVVIHDATSHAVVSLLHVAPAAHLKADAFVDVKAGDVIGQLAPSPVADQKAHVHLSALDMNRQSILNPMMYLSEYNDKTPPTIQRAYFLNESGEALTDLTDGSLDLVIEAYDKDQDSQRSFEIAAVDFEIKDLKGKSLRSVSDCDFGRFTEKNYSEVFDPRDALDLGGALPASSNLPAKPGEEKAFRFVITNLQSNGREGGCHLLHDEKGYLLVDEKIPGIKVRVKVYDHMGNASSKEFEFKRNQTAI